jgi:hypothetical protein
VGSLIGKDRPLPANSPLGICRRLAASRMPMQVSNLARPQYRRYQVRIFQPLAYRGASNEKTRRRVAGPGALPILGLLSQIGHLNFAAI